MNKGPNSADWSMESASRFYNRAQTEEYLKDNNFTNLEIASALGLGVGNIATLEKKGYVFKIRLLANNVEYEIEVSRNNPSFA